MQFILYIIQRNRYIPSLLSSIMLNTVLPIRTRITLNVYFVLLLSHFVFNNPERCELNWAKPGSVNSPTTHYVLLTRFTHVVIESAPANIHTETTERCAHLSPLDRSERWILKHYTVLLCTRNILLHHSFAIYINPGSIFILLLECFYPFDFLHGR